MVTPGLATGAAPLLADFSLEITGRDAGKLDEARDAIPPGTRINVTFLEHEEPRMRLDAVRAVRQSGFVPVPHLPARRLRSEAMLAEFLAALRAAGATDSGRPGPGGLAGCAARLGRGRSRLRPAPGCCSSARWPAKVSNWCSGRPRS